MSEVLSGVCQKLLGLQRGSSPPLDDESGLRTAGGCRDELGSDVLWSYWLKLNCLAKMVGSVSRDSSQLHAVVVAKCACSL